MNRIAGILTLLIACLPLATTIANEQILASIKNEFVQQITAGSNDVKVREINDTQDNKKIFLKKSLPGLYVPGNEKVAYKEIFVRLGKESGHYHLGVISLDYDDKQKARATFNKIKNNRKSKYFSNTKILTKYELLLKDKSVVVLYSETFIDPKVRSFLHKATQQK